MEMQGLFAFKLDNGFKVEWVQEGNLGGNDYNYMSQIYKGLPLKRGDLIMTGATSTGFFKLGDVEINFNKGEGYSNQFAYRLAPDGTVIRYLYGPRFLPFDVGMALTEAAKGTPGLSIRKLLTYCFDYDPESKSYMVRSFRLLALGIVALLGILFFFIVRKK